MSKQVVVEEGSIFGHMLRGSGWALLMRWSTRAIGFVSIMILARLLSPEDFGIWAMASLMIGFLSMFTEMGVTALIIREQKASPAFCNTGWTMQILQGLFVAVMLVMLAPLAGWYFGEPRAVPVVYLLALSSVVSGMRNIGMVLVRKELDFARDFRFNVYSRAFKLLVTVGLAFILRNYWAIAFAQLATVAFEVLLSYRMHSYRPRLGLARARQFLRFASSIVPTDVAQFLNRRIDVLVVGGIANSTTLGLYNVAGDLPKMVTREIVISAGRGLLPTYSHISTDRAELARAYIYSISALTLLFVPLGVGMAVVSEDFVHVVLGSKWLDAVPVLRWLALYALFTATQEAIMSSIFIVTNNERRAMQISWLRLIVLVPPVIISGIVWGVIGVAIAATCVSAGFITVVLFEVAKVLPITMTKIGEALWRPAAAAIIMAGVVMIAHVESFSALPRLVTDVGVGATAYVIVVLSLWRISGSPSGVEHAIVSQVQRKFGIPFRI